MIQLLRRGGSTQHKLLDVLSGLISWVTGRCNEIVLIEISAELPTVPSSMTRAGDLINLQTPVDF